MARSLSLAAVLLVASASHAGGPRRLTLVVCAPGYPGSTAEAQPTMDALAAALARAAGVPAQSLGAVYAASEKDGLARLSAPDAAVALVTLPFLLKHQEALKLVPRLAVETQGSEAGEVWALVAQKGRVATPAALEGFTIYSIAGYAPDFVRGALGTWGSIPQSAKVVESGQVLSSLRKAAGGAEVAVLLDGAQASALSGLPFAGELEVVARSAKLPSAFVAQVEGRMPAALARGFEKLSTDAEGAAVLANIRMSRFRPLDPTELSALRRLATGAPK